MFLLVFLYQNWKNAEYIYIYIYELIIKKANLEYFLKKTN